MRHSFSFATDSETACEFLETWFSRIRTSWIQSIVWGDHPFKGQEIGRWWSSSAITTEGFVAMIYGDVGSNLGYPKGVKVWNSAGKEWVTIDAKWMNTIVGWIKE